MSRADEPLQIPPVKMIVVWRGLPQTPTLFFISHTASTQRSDSMVLHITPQGLETHSEK